MGSRWRLPDFLAHNTELHVGGMIYRVEGGVVQDVDDDRHAGHLRGKGAVRLDDATPAPADPSPATRTK